MHVIRTQAEADEGARIGNTLALPALVSLIAAQGRLCGVIPFAGRRAVHIMLTNQRGLDLAGALAVNGHLPTRLARLLTRVMGNLVGLRRVMCGRFLRGLSGRLRGKRPSQQENHCRGGKLLCPLRFQFCPLFPSPKMARNVSCARESPVVPGPSLAPLIISQNAARRQCRWFKVTVTEVCRRERWFRRCVRCRAGAPGTRHPARSSDLTGRGRSPRPYLPAAC
jgi:hypothetical protein